MTQDFGKGFTVANLKNMRQFYLTFPNGYALRSELSQTHYRLLMRVENDKAREFYMQEAVKSQWSTIQLDGAMNVNHVWLIPKEADKPTDERYKKVDKQLIIILYATLWRCVL